MSSKQRFKLIPAVYLILRKKDEVLLLERQNTGYQDGMRSLVAGHLDGGELATQAMIREAKEEAGITIQPQDLNHVYTTHRLSGDVENERVDLFFECSKWQGEIQNMEPTKCSDLSWFSIQSLPDNLIAHIKIVLQDVAQGKTFSEYTEEPVL